MKKYKIRKRKKLISPYVIFAIFAISMLLVSTCYALFNEKLNIVGQANFLDSTPYEPGNSIYNYLENGDWPNQDGTYTYGTQIIIKNLDETITDNLEIAFDLPEGFVYDSSSSYNIWQADSFSFSNNRLTIKFKSYASYFAKGDTLTIWPQLKFESENVPNEIITNLTINGKLTTLDTTLS